MALWWTGELSRPGILGSSSSRVLFSHVAVLRSDLLRDLSSVLIRPSLSDSAVCLFVSRQDVPEQGSGAQGPRHHGNANGSVMLINPADC